MNGIEDFKNGMEDNLLYFHTNSTLDLVHVFTEKYIQMSGSDKQYCPEAFNIYTYYLSTNRGTLVVYVEQTVYRDCIIVSISKLQFAALLL